MHRDPGRLFKRLHLVADRRYRPLGERHHPGRGNPDGPAGWRHPLGPPAQHPLAEVKQPFVRAQFAIADVEGLVVDKQPDHLAVGHVDDRLPGFRKAVSSLCIGQRAQRVHPVEVGPGQAVRLALVQVAPPPQVPVRQCEHRLCLGQQVQVQLGFPERPRLCRERRLPYHGRSIRSARSATAMSAPCALSAAAWSALSTPTT